ncbi:hypothetical protein [uncultured Desulfovibrio sp.]|uniref:hypothetical protein n=1 Tax=uncultured Desulfovibrio sp. TaxID=167968 RepID=UPI0025F484C5|nr:hypothetical protein [uncultured Desulfovibrio sp.]
MKKAILKLTADTMQKLAIVGIALGVFQEKTDGIWLAGAFLLGSYILTAWEAKQ